MDLVWYGIVYYGIVGVLNWKEEALCGGLARWYNTRLVEGYFLLIEIWPDSLTLFCSITLVTIDSCTVQLDINIHYSR